MTDRETIEYIKSGKGLPPLHTPRKEAEWQDRTVSEIEVCEMQSAKCSNCEKYLTTPFLYYFNHYNYCPNCGAKMTGGKSGIYQQTGNN